MLLRTCVDDVGYENHSTFRTSIYPV